MTRTNFRSGSVPQFSLQSLDVPFGHSQNCTASGTIASPDRVDAALTAAFMPAVLLGVRNAYWVPARTGTGQGCRVVSCSPNIDNVGKYQEQHWSDDGSRDSSAAGCTPEKLTESNRKHDASHSTKLGYWAVIGCRPKAAQPELLILLVPEIFIVSATSRVQAVEPVFPRYSTLS